MAPNIKDVSYTNGIVEDEKRNLNSISTKRPTTEIVWRNVILFVYLHISAVYGFYLFLFAAKWQTMFFAFLLHLYGGLGITAGAHRLWAHKSYKAKAPLRIFLMLCNCVAFENDVYEWSRDHRVHHKFSETDADPHNATRGFFFSHMGWLLVRKHPDVRDKGGKVDMADLAADKVLMFQRKYYIPLVVSMCFMMPSFGPHYFWGESLPIAFYVCAMFRYTVTLHSTWLVNSAAHMWGQRPYDKNINPAENKYVSALACGEGWHNYHHTFPYDYKTSELGYRINMTTMFIDFWSYLGLAYDRKTVPVELIRRRIVKTGDGSYRLRGHDEDDDGDQEKSEGHQD